MDLGQNSFAMYVPSESAHVLPFFHAVRRIWPSPSIYYYVSDSHDSERVKYGWNDVHGEASVLLTETSRQNLETVPVLQLGLRDCDIIERRLRRGLITIYASERWLKPVQIRCKFGCLKFTWTLPGIVRVLVPRYRKLVRRFVCYFQHPCFYYHSDGVHAASDMARLCGLMSGDLRCLFKPPKLTFERVPSGRVLSAAPQRYGTGHIRLGGYFVSPSIRPRNHVVETSGALRILWLGRLIDWKHPETALYAVRQMAPDSCSLTYIGEGPEERRLRRLAKGMPNVDFFPFLHKDRVREKMHDFDVLVMTSDSCEGWGAVVSEALEEGLIVLGTYEAGASATILPDEALFHAGDWRSLVVKLTRCTNDKKKGRLVGPGVGAWSAEKAGVRFVEWMKGIRHA